MVFSPSSWTVVTGGILIALIIFSAGICFQGINQLIGDHQERERTLNKLRELTGIRVAVIQTESASRAFVLSHRPADATEFRTRKAELKSHLQALLDSSSGTGADELRVQQFDEALGKVLTLLELEMSTRFEGPAEARGQLAKLRQEQMDFCRVLLDQTTLEQETSLREQLTDWNTKAHRGRKSILMAGLLEFLVVGILTYVVAAQLIRRQTFFSRLALVSVTESADDAIFDLDLNGRVTSWNHGAERIYGYSAKEIIGSSYTLLCRPSDTHELQDLIASVKARKRRQRYETTRVAKNGSLLSIAHNAWPKYNAHGDVVGACVMSRDISAQKKAEEALRRSEEQYRILFATHPLPMWVAHSETLHILAVNDAAISGYGYSRDEFLSMSIRDISVDGSSMCSSPASSPSSDRTANTQLTRHRKKNGIMIDVETTKHTLSFEGRPAMLILAHDVTEQKLAEARLQSSEQKFAKAFYMSPLGVTITTRAEGRYVDANETFLKMLGYTRDQVIGKTVFDLKLWASKGDRENMLLGLDRSGRVTMDSVFTTCSGDARIVQVFAEAIELDGAPCILAITQDVTEKRQLENQLRQAQKMEAVGRLAGGVAHDFNNMLGVIGGYTELLGSSVKDPVAQDYIKEICTAVDRAASLTRQLLAFSRKQVLLPKQLDLNERIRELSKMVGRLIGDDIELVLNPAEDLAPVEADPGQVDQVILNLVVNARDAMPEGGTIILETANVSLDNNVDFQQGAIKPGNYVMLAVSDTGHGMDPETLAHIFEPFFTTKEQGKGTGLGLSTVHGIVSQSNGHIWVSSQAGKGSTFKVYLPVAGQPSSVAAQKRADQNLTLGSGTILLVEDEQQMLFLTRQLLTEHGYRVLEATDGVAALEVARKHGEIDLLLTDVVMPRLSGPGLADQIRHYHPCIAVVYMSGYTDELLANHGALARGITFLEKPFTQQDLIRAVQAAMSEAGTRRDPNTQARSAAPSV
jgi:PAS domain S-box-containing protein